MGMEVIEVNAIPEHGKRVRKVKDRLAPARPCSEVSEQPTQEDEAASIAQSSEPVVQQGGKRRRKKSASSGGPRGRREQGTPNRRLSDLEEVASDWCWNNCWLS